MSVTLTTQFYENDGNTWVDFEKVVFTSPNIPSPSSAGTRSNIIPGELPLGLWYEDASNMYRYMTEQVPTISGYQTLDTTNSGFHAQVSVVFEVTSGECYDCRLTAWDDSSHSTTNKYMITNDHVRVSAVSYRADGSKEVPSSFVEVFAPQYNITLKGDTSVSGIDYYYGDFNMIYANPTTGKNGDYFIFKPWLYGIDGTVTAVGQQDFLITFHYTYT